MRRSFAPKNAWVCAVAPDRATHCQGTYHSKPPYILRAVRCCASTIHRSPAKFRCLQVQSETSLRSSMRALLAETNFSIRMRLYTSYTRLCSWGVNVSLEDVPQRRLEHPHCAAYFVIYILTGIYFGFEFRKFYNYFACYSLTL